VVLRAIRDYRVKTITPKLKYQPYVADRAIATYHVFRHGRSFRRWLQRSKFQLNQNSECFKSTTPFPPSAEKREFIRGQIVVMHESSLRRNRCPLGTTCRASTSVMAFFNIESPPRTAKRRSLCFTLAYLQTKLPGTHRRTHATKVYVPSRHQRSIYSAACTSCMREEEVKVKRNHAGSLQPQHACRSFTSPSDHTSICRAAVVRWAWMRNRHACEEAVAARLWMRGER
jgi:hypothetical protein